MLRMQAAVPGTIAGIREWFRWYKTPDGKPTNNFGHGEQCLDRDAALRVVEEAHEAWGRLVAGTTPANGLWVR